jgi:hypothetical protein
MAVADAVAGFQHAPQQMVAVQLLLLPLLLLLLHWIPLPRTPQCVVIRAPDSCQVGPDSPLLCEELLHGPDVNPREVDCAAMLGQVASELGMWKNSNLIEIKPIAYIASSRSHRTINRITSSSSNSETTRAEWNVAFDVC